MVKKALTKARRGQKGITHTHTRALIKARRGQKGIRQTDRHTHIQQP